MGKGIPLRILWRPCHLLRSLRHHPAGQAGGIGARRKRTVNTAALGIDARLRNGSGLRLGRLGVAIAGGGAWGDASGGKEEVGGWGCQYRAIGMGLSLWDKQAGWGRMGLELHGRIAYHAHRGSCAGKSCVPSRIAGLGECGLCLIDRRSGVRDRPGFH